jgi:hypothetical protein
MAGAGERISNGEIARGWGNTWSYWSRLSTKPTSVACVKWGGVRALAILEAMNDLLSLDLNRDLSFESWI